MILLDSSILIELFRKKDKEKTFFYSLSQIHKEFYIGNRKSHSDFWESLSEKLSIIPFEKACSNNAVTIYLELLKANRMIDLADILIGATAITFKIPIATLNIKHFTRINGLEILKR